MADSKYGRIFTEDDLKKIAGHRLEISGEYEMMDIVKELDEAGELTFPPDEPLFTLRAKDRLSLGVIRAYFDHCIRVRDIDRTHVDNVEQAHRAFDAFRTEHPDRMKIPD